MKDIIHIHIPKCGGTWLDKTLRRYAPQYFLTPEFGDGNRCSLEDVLPWRGRYNPSSRHFHNKTGPTYVDVDVPPPGIWERAHKIAICRNPFDLLVSMWHFTDYPYEFCREYLGDVEAGAGMANLRHGIKTFEEYIEKFCNPDFPWWGTQEQQDGARFFMFHQMFNHDGTCGIDTIIRQEQLSFGTAALLSEMGYITEQQHHEIVGSKRKNTGKHRGRIDYRGYYSDKLRELVEKKCKAELVLFGYNFDGPTDRSPYVDPATLFYHAIIPTCGVNLGPEEVKKYDEGLRNWLRADNLNRRHIVTAQSITPDIWLRIPGQKAEIPADTIGNSDVVVIQRPINFIAGNDLDPKPMFGDWNKTHPLVTQTIVGSPIIYDKASLKNLVGWDINTKDNLLTGIEDQVLATVSMYGYSVSIKITISEDGTRLLWYENDITDMSREELRDLNDRLRRDGMKVHPKAWETIADGLDKVGGVSGYLTRYGKK